MKKLRVYLFCAACLALISWDRATKDMAIEHLKNKAPVSYLHNTIQLMYAENTGAAMSLGDALPKTLNVVLLGVLPLALLVGGFIYTIKRSKDLSFLRLFSLALIISGGLGNISDRLLHDRHVTDFIFIDLKSVHTGIFNFADVFVSFGVILFLISSYQRKKTIREESYS